MRPRIFRSSALLAAAAAAVLVFTGCAAGGASTTPASSAAAAAGSVDTMFGTIEVPKPSSDLKVVALGWSDAEMALSLGVAPIAVYDWQGFGASTKGVGPWASSLFGDTTPTIIERGSDALNYEQIASLSPDLILNTRSDNDQAAFDRLNQIAPTVYAPTGTAAFATDWATQLTSVSEALGKADEGTALIAKTKQSIADAAAAHPEFAGRTAVAGTKFGEAYGAYLAGDGRFDVLADLGFVAAPAVKALGDGGFFAAVSVENVSALNADVLVMLPIGLTKAETEADPLLQSLPAVQAGRAVVLDPDSEIANAYSAASVLSIPVVLDKMVPLLATAAAKVPAA